MFNSTLYNALRLVACLITVCALLAHYFLPKKSFLAVPYEHSYPAIYSDADYGGKSQASWVDEDALISNCVLVKVPNQTANCGVVLAWGSDPTVGQNLESYDGFHIKLNYSGPAERIRIYLRNFDPRYSTIKDEASAKFESILLRTEDLHEALFIGFEEISVADWWVSEYKLTRELARPQFSNIVSFGIDYMEEGDHTLQIESLNFVGERFETEKLLLAIIIVWMTVLIWEGLDRFYHLYQRSRDANKLISDLVGSYSKLEQQKKKYEKLSTRDALTGALNRYGFWQETNAIYEPESRSVSAALILVDADHFKRINDTKGHDIGDAVLKELTSIIQNTIRQTDVFARWGGEEFILLCKEADLEVANKIAELIRKTVEHHSFNVSDDTALSVTVSIGLTMVKASDDNFDPTFKRADIALYKAKSSGRNKVVAG